MKFTKLVKAKNDYKIEEIGNGNWQIDVPGVGGGQILKVDKFSTLDAVSNYEVILWDKNSEMLPKKYADTFREAKMLVMNHLKSQKSSEKIESKKEVKSVEMNDLEVTEEYNKIWGDLIYIDDKIKEILKNISENKNEEAKNKLVSLRTYIDNMKFGNMKNLWMEITKLYFNK